MRTLRRPMFKLGGQAKEEGNTGIMDGLVDREQLQEGSKEGAFPVGGKMDKFVNSPVGNALLYGIPGAIGDTVYTPINQLGRLFGFNPGLSSRRGVRDQKDYLFGTDRPDRMLDKEVNKSNFFGLPFDATPFYDDGTQKSKEDLSTVPGSKMPPGGGDPTMFAEKKIPDEETENEKRSRLEIRAKEFEELLNPGARKRVITNALAAASGAFGKSTGNTLQDVGNAISAAAGATGKMDENKQLAAKLAIEEDVKKEIAGATYKPNSTESLMNYYKEAGYSTKEALDKINKTDSSELDYIYKLGSPGAGKSMYVSRVEMAGNEKFGGILSTDKKERQKMIDEGDPNQFFYDSNKDAYVSIVTVDGERTTKVIKRR
tara:strand:- start:4002 stop:5120 length:1119 start_codon:yes stop_codon:yes gene_type:complete